MQLLQHALAIGPGPRARMRMLVVAYLMEVNVALLETMLFYVSNVNVNAFYASELTFEFAWPGSAIAIALAGRSH